MAQSVECPTLAQVMILQFVSSSPELVSMLAAQSLEPASDFLSPSLCPSPTHAQAHALSRALSLSLSRINIKKNFKSPYVLEMYTEIFIDLKNDD